MPPLRLCGCAPASVLHEARVDAQPAGRAAARDEARVERVGADVVDRLVDLDLLPALVTDPLLASLPTDYDDVVSCRVETLVRDAQLQILEFMVQNARGVHGVGLPLVPPSFYSDKPPAAAVTGPGSAPTRGLPADDRTNPAQVGPLARARRAPRTGDRRRAR